MKFTIEQIDQMERDLSKAVSAARQFADQDTSMRLSNLIGLMAEVRHFVHCVLNDADTTEACDRWVDLFVGGDE